MDNYVPTAVIRAQMKVSRWTVTRLIEAGELSGIKVGRNWRISVDSYRDFVERHTVPPADQRTDR